MPRSAVVLALCVLLLAPPLLHAADGDVDPTFGGTGVVTAPFAAVNSFAGGGLALLPEGKILVATIDPSGLEFARYDATGTLDPSFGTGGVKTVPAPSGLLSEIAVLLDGKIVVLAADVLARYDGDGNPDASFGSGGVVTLPDCGVQNSDADLLVRPDGAAIVSFVNRDGDSCVIRIAPSGLPDATFGAAGIVTMTDFQVYAVAAQGDRILAGGYDAVARGAVLRRLFSNGDPDGGFFSSVLSDANVVVALHVREDGTVFVVDEAARVMRLHSNGKLDTSFGVDGVAGPAFEPYSDVLTVTPRAMVIQPDGRIVVGFSTWDASTLVGVRQTMLERYDADGTVDASYGTDGVHGSVGHEMVAMAMQPDGKVLVAGITDAIPFPPFGTVAAFHLARHIGTTLACPASAAPGCHGGTIPLAGKLRMDEPTGNPKAKYQWSWTKGAATTVGDFGDPVAGDDYTLCVYDESSGSQLATGAKIPGGGLCKGKPCWKPLGTSGFAYTDSKRVRYGIGSIKLKAGVDGKAHLSIKGLGSTLQVPPLPAALPLRVQLFAANGQCWESVFSTTGTTRNDGDRYQGKSD